jgi:alkylhydroperoxidase family enzyme
LGRAAGITDEELADLSRFQESGAFGPVEKLVLDLAVGMAATPANVSDELFAELRRHFTEAQLVELVSDIAMGNMRSRFNRAFQCQPAGFSEGTYCPLPEK